LKLSMLRVQYYFFIYINYVCVKGSTSVFDRPALHNQVGGVIFGYSETSIRVWIPDGTKASGVYYHIMFYSYEKLNIAYSKWLYLVEVSCM